jgi:hypothetical protein
MEAGFSIPRAACLYTHHSTQVACPIQGVNIAIIFRPEPKHACPPKTIHGAFKRDPVCNHPKYIKGQCREPYSRGSCSPQWSRSRFFSYRRAIRRTYEALLPPASIAVNLASECLKPAICSRCHQPGHAVFTCAALEEDCACPEVQLFPP